MVRTNAGWRTFRVALWRVKRKRKKEGRMHKFQRLSIVGGGQKGSPIPQTFPPNDETRKASFDVS